jgi:hydrogenase-4 component E
MPDLLNAILVIVMILNLFALGSSSILSVIRIAAAQGVFLAAMPLLIRGDLSLPILLSAFVAAALKGFAIPAVMKRSLRSVRIKREVEPRIGLMASVLIGAAATGAAVLLSSRIRTVGMESGSLIVATSIATVLAGFIILTTRYKALTQVIGYLILENGIYVFGLLLVDAMPFVIEMGVLLDLFVGIFVISIITNRINEAFSSMDTRRLVSLKE